VFFSLGGVLNAAGNAVQHILRSDPMRWSLNLPDAITYALFGGGLIAVAVVRRRRT